MLRHRLAPALALSATLLVGTCSSNPDQDPSVRQSAEIIETATTLYGMDEFSIKSYSRINELMAKYVTQRSISGYAPPNYCEVFLDMETVDENGNGIASVVLSPVRVNDLLYDDEGVFTTVFTQDGSVHFSGGVIATYEAGKEVDNQFFESRFRYIGFVNGSRHQSGENSQYTGPVIYDIGRNGITALDSENSSNYVCYTVGRVEAHVNEVISNSDIQGAEEICNN